MKIPYATPELEGSKRSRESRDVRHLVAQLERLRPHALSRANYEEQDHAPFYPINFTKGLLHNDYGILVHPEDYWALVKAINSIHEDFFDTEVKGSVDREVNVFHCKIPKPKACDNPKHLDDKRKYKKLDNCDWRGWESPRAGHVFSLQGPDSGAVGMAPAPRVGSSELAVEVAEVYALALLRDVPFTSIALGRNETVCKKGHCAAISIPDLLKALNGMAFFSGDSRVSSTPRQSHEGLNKFERNRLEARLGSETELSAQTLFRGSTPRSQDGPYISQFMLVGNKALAGGVENDPPSFRGISAKSNIFDGNVVYGTQIIDQRITVHKPCLDYMTDWTSWLDVQNGAAIKNVDQFEEERRYITTPRDLATYVHYDALYQAYLNACLLLLNSGTKTSKGFPEPSPTGRRSAFATFGGPHILSLVTEVATRCLKAVRRQKFNYHRRARPEVVGGRLTLIAHGDGDQLHNKSKHLCAEPNKTTKKIFEKLLADIPVEIRDAVIKHNKEQNSSIKKDWRRIKCDVDAYPGGLNDDLNLLLPMAFPEGSPMHPAYGAGHATVAGGCVTMLKGFFEMFEDADAGTLRKLEFPCTGYGYFVPSNDGKTLNGVKEKPLTIQGELNKLAANISIGRNMAGVHYYSDYYDSLRMGERVAVGILLEQAICYGDAIEMTFDSFDGDRIAIYGRGGNCPELIIHDKHGNPVREEDWWIRHVVGSALIEDL